jgi:hypothetical protein
MCSHKKEETWEVGKEIFDFNNLVVCQMIMWAWCWRNFEFSGPIPQDRVVHFRGGQRAGLGRYGSKTSNRPKPWVEIYNPHRTVFEMRVKRVRVKRFAGQTDGLIRIQFQMKKINLQRKIQKYLLITIVYEYEKYLETPFNINYCWKKKK